MQSPVALHTVQQVPVCSATAAPQILILSPAETVDGRMHTALRNELYFSTAAERKAFTATGATWEIEHAGRTLYGCEHITYLD